MIKNRKIVVLCVCFMAFCAVFALFSPYNFSKAVFAQENNQPKTKAKAMMVLEASSLRPLYYFNEKQRLPMASTTKIITAIYVIENNPDLNKIVQIPAGAVGIEGTSIGLKEGEHLTIKELLYGLMLRSGNDAAVALAIETSGTETAFIDGVNKFLKEKGFDDTCIANPHGLPANNHYTSAKDLAEITAYAMNNPVFREIVSTKEIKISNELKTKHNRNLINKNKLLTNYELADGVKTGYTRQAGRCFVGSASKDGMRLVCVLLNCAPMFEECQQLFEKGFDEFKMFKLVSKNDKLGTISVDKSSTKNIDLYAKDDFYYPLKREELKDVSLSVDYKKKKTAPIQEGELLGEIKIKIKNQLIFCEELYNINYIKPNTFNSEFERVVKKM